jgi:3-deoxy-7-phosphoheptulonate synthase
VTNPAPPTALAIVLRPTASTAAREEVLAAATELGFGAAVARGDGWAALSVGDGVRTIPVQRFDGMEAVERVVAVSSPYRLASTETFPDTSIRVGRGRRAGTTVGNGAPLTVMVSAAGSARRLGALLGLAVRAREGGASVLHVGELVSEGDGGVTPSITAAQLSRLRPVADALGLSLSVEISDVCLLGEAQHHADLLHVGHRNMQNFTLLRELGDLELPVVLRRGVGATVEEFMLAAEYVLATGNGRVILCEAAIRTSDGARPRFEVNVIPLLQQSTHLPIIADPSHATTHPHLLPAVARACVAAGADGLLLELGATGSERSPAVFLDPSQLPALVAGVRPVARAMGRRLDQPRPPAMDWSVAAETNDAEPAADGAELESPMDVLHRTDRTLSSVFESIVGARPRLEVLAQSRIRPPHPSWLSWLLHPDGELLVRWTRYVLGDTILSRNLAYVDLGRVDRAIVERLESGRLNLGDLFRAQEIDRFGFEFGTGADAGAIDVTLRQEHKEPPNLHPYVWRRYIAATSGRVGFLVIESLPTRTWQRILRTRRPVVGAVEAAT